MTLWTGCKGTARSSPWTGNEVAVKVLFAGVYRESTGWGEAACRYALALDAAGVDVVCRPVLLDQASRRPPERVLELESRPSRGCDVVIQHVLPHMMEYHGRFDCNVGLYFSETDSIARSSWNDRLNLMDAAWGCSAQMQEAARRSFVTVPYAVVPVPCDPDVYRRSRTLLPAVSRLKEAGDFVFYTVGEMVRRKNLQGLLKAFHAEFDPDEPVQLVIKTSRPGMPSRETHDHVLAFCGEIKRGLKLYDPKHYKQEVILTERLTEDELLGLHEAADCFVQPSYGEAWSLPAFDAMALGKTPIVTDWGGYREFVTEDCGWPVPCHTEQVFGIDDTFRDLHTGHESWAAVAPVSLRRAMRQAYEDAGLRAEKARAGVLRAADFSFQTVGKAMRGVLEGYERAKRA